MSFVLKPSRHARKALRLALRTAFAIALVTGFSLRNWAQTTDQTRPANGAPTRPASTFPEPSSNPPSASYPASAPNPAAPVPSADLSRYVISPGDVLDVSVFGAPDLTLRAAVNRSGNIYMPLINYVHVAGMDVEDAQGVVEQAYFKDGVLKIPHVSIVVSSYSGKVVLMGEVGRQGLYPIVGSGTLLDILAQAGGVTATAGQLMTITHKDDTEPEKVLWPSDPEKFQDANVPVYPGDIIVVSKAGVIFVVGEVLSPNSYLMDENGKYSVMKAVAASRGPTKWAKTSKAYIVRREPGGQKAIPIPLDKILATKAADVQMQANDILFVPSNKEKIVASQAVGIAVGLATSLAYYHIAFQ